MHTEYMQYGSLSLLNHLNAVGYITHTEMTQLQLMGYDKMENQVGFVQNKEIMD